VAGSCENAFHKMLVNFSVAKRLAASRGLDSMQLVKRKVHPSGATHGIHTVTIGTLLFQVSVDITNSTNVGECAFEPRLHAVTSSRDGRDAYESQVRDIIRPYDFVNETG
jgi:hypothetical protein